MNRQMNETKTLLDIGSVLLKYRWRFVIPTFAVLTGVLLVSLLLPRKYVAEAIFERRTDMVLSEIMQRGAAQTFHSPQRTLVEELAGQPAIDSLIEHLRYTDAAHLVRGKDQADLYSLQNELKHKTNVTFDISSKELDRVRVSFINRDPALARTVVNTLVETYIDRTRALIDDRLTQTATFFDSEVARNRQLIEDLENKKLSFEIENAHLLPDSPGSIQTLLTDAQMQMIMLQQEYDASAMRVQSLTRLIETTSPTVPRITTAPNPKLTAINAKLEELREKLNLFAGQYQMTDKHPDLIALRTQIADLERQAASTATEVITQRHVETNRKRDQLDVQLSQAQIEMMATDKQLHSIKEQINKLNIQTANLFPIRSDYQKLNRQIEQAQRQLAFWEDNLRRVQIALTAESGDRGISMEFIKPAEAATKPTSPNLAQVLASAIVLGLAAGAISVFLAYRTDETFSDGEELAETFNLPLVGSVSEVITAHQNRLRWIKNRVVYPLNIAGMTAVVAFLAALLYLDLEKPLVFEQLKEQPSQFVRQKLTSGEPVGQPQHSETRP